MPLIQPDTSEAIDMAPVKPGTYKAKIISVEAQTSKKGNPMIVPKFQFYEQVGDKSQKRERNSWLVTSGEGAGGFDQLLRACRFHQLADQYKDKSVQPKPPFDTDQLVGQELMIVVEESINPNNGQKNDSIRSYLPA